MSESKFEAWRDEYESKEGHAFPTRLEVWQASRRAALEEAACIVDAEEENARQECYYPGVVGAFEECATAIRALANGVGHE